MSETWTTTVNGKKKTVTLTARESRGVRLSIDSVLIDARRWLNEMGLPWDEHEDGTNALARLWNAQPQQHGSEGAGWYKRPDVSREMLRELAAWHVADANVSLRNASIVSHCGVGRVLDFGGGICTLAIAMSIAGSKVEVIEPGPWMRAFGAERAARLGARIKFVDAPDGLYDSIIAMDVVEHMERPAAFLELAAEHLTPSGKIAINWVFHKDDLHPQHIAECTDESAEFHETLANLFGPALESAAMTQNGWPSIHERKIDEQF